MTQQVKNDLFSVRVDPKLKAQATAILAAYGLTLSDAVRMLLTRITIEKRLPQGLTTDKDAYDAWFRKKVQEALDSIKPKHSHEDVMTRVDNAIEQVVKERIQHA